MQLCRWTDTKSGEVISVVAGRVDIFWVDIIVWPRKAITTQPVEYIATLLCRWIDVVHSCDHIEGSDDLRPPRYSRRVGRIASKAVNWNQRCLEEKVSASSVSQFHSVMIFQRDVGHD